MGLFDFILSLFGGGAKMAVSLDVDRVPVGGILSGTATLKGAPKDCEASTVKVQLLYVHVEAQEDSPIPKIETKVLVDQVIANNVALAANGEESFPFTVSIAGGTEPTAHNVSYKVKVVADVAGMKDPAATMDLTVVEGSGEGDALTAEGLYARWPALRGTEVEPLKQALRDMRWKHDEDEGENDLRVAEPILVKLLSHADTEVRMAAFETWANIVSGSLRTEHIARMKQVLEGVQGAPRAMNTVISAMGPAMDMGAEQVVIPYLTHEDVDVRVAAVRTLSWGRGGTARARHLFPCLKDVSAEVRAQAVSTLGNYKDDAEILAALVEIAGTDDSPEVLQNALGGLALCWTDGKADLVRPVYERARTHSDPKVRERYAHWIGWPARVDDVSEHIRALVRDPELRVAKTMSFEFNNLLRDKKQYTELCMETWKDEALPMEVRGNALGALPSGMAAANCVAFYKELVAGGADEAVQDAIVRGLKFEDGPEYKALLQEFTESPFADVARRARSYL